jgi:hypothetical protein
MAAVAVLYLPCEHSVQAAEPFVSLKLPAIHAAHSAPSGPMYPLLHVQFNRMLLPAPEYVCAGQSLHVASNIAPVPVEYLPCEHCEHGDDPFTSLKEPATHALHTAPSGPVYPLLHVQSVSSPLPAIEYVPDGQSTHCPPALSLYFPAGHSLQGPPAGPEYPCAFVCGFSRVHLPAYERACRVICVYISQTHRDTQKMETRKGERFVLPCCICSLSGFQQQHPKT